MRVHAHNFFAAIILCRVSCSYKDMQHLQYWRSFNLLPSVLEDCLRVGDT